MLNRTLARAHDSSGTGTVITQMLRRRVPIHFGGMSDPFIPYEATGQKTLDTLKILAKYDYPTIISTKGDLLLDPVYFDLVSSGRFAIQISFSTLDDELSKFLEFNTPGPSARLNMISKLSSICWISARLQPMIPGNIEMVKQEIKRLAGAGVKHVSVEFLKIPFIDSKNLLSKISAACDRDIWQYFDQKRTSGMEFIVNKDFALDWHSQLQRVAMENNISYSSADTDLLPYDGSDSCCSGTAEIEGFGNYYRYTFPQAIRNAIRSGETEVRHEHLKVEWAPSGSIKHFLNSKTRIEGQNDIPSFMAHKWNNSNRTIGPLAFHDIHNTNKKDTNGMRIFRIGDAALATAHALGLMK